MPWSCLHTVADPEGGTAGSKKKKKKKKKCCMYKLLFSRGFYFREFREPDPRENFHFNSCLFIVMTTSEKS